MEKGLRQAIAVTDLQPRVGSGATTLAPRIFLLGASPSITAEQTAAAKGNKEIGRSAHLLRATGQNTGNQVIAYGLLKTVKHQAVNWDSSIGPQRVDEEYDHILIAAANFLHSGFDLGGMASFIEATNLPCTMVGVGAQSKDYSTDIKLQPGTERLMRVVAERSGLIGARGAFTAAVLSKMGIHNVQVTGCPSYYMSCRPTLEIRKPALTRASRLLINSSRDVVSHAFDREKMIEIVCGLVSLAIEREADFVPQSELPEIRIAESSSPEEIETNVHEILRTFAPFNRVATYEKLLLWFSKHVRVYWDVSLWQEAMKSYDFVFGNRFHGNMIALQAGTPACVICHDTRTTEMCEFLGLPHVALKDASKVDVDHLYSLVDPEAIQARYKQLYPQFRKFLTLNGLQPVLR
jgi:hypothetical protein